MDKSALEEISGVRQYGKHGGVTYIYFLVRNDEVVYVGQTRKLGQRIEQQKRKKSWDECWVFQVDKRDIDATEQALIRCISPEENRAHSENPPTDLDRKILDHFGFDEMLDTI